MSSALKKLKGTVPISPASIDLNKSWNNQMVISRREGNLPVSQERPF